MAVTTAFEFLVIFLVKCVCDESKIESNIMFILKKNAVFEEYINNIITETKVQKCYEIWKARQWWTNNNNDKFFWVKNLYHLEGVIRNRYVLNYNFITNRPWQEFFASNKSITEISEGTDTICTVLRNCYLCIMIILSQSRFNWI